MRPIMNICIKQNDKNNNGNEPIKKNGCGRQVQRFRYEKFHVDCLLIFKQKFGIIIRNCKAKTREDKSIKM